MSILESSVVSEWTIHGMNNTIYRPPSYINKFAGTIISLTLTARSLREWVFLNIVINMEIYAERFKFPNVLQVTVLF